jgi:hypothetical protein
MSNALPAVAHLLRAETPLAPGLEHLGLEAYVYDRDFTAPDPEGAHSWSTKRDLDRVWSANMKVISKHTFITLCINIHILALVVATGYVPHAHMLYCPLLTQVGHAFTAATTVMVDDTPSKMRHLPTNVLLVPEYTEASVQQGEGSSVLQSLQQTLQLLLDADSADVREHIAAQQAHAAQAQLAPV